MSHLLIETMCLPPVPVMHAIVRHSGVILEAHEHYQKRSFRNRIYMAGPQGKEHFSIPLEKGKNEQQNIRECTISYNENWPLKLSRQIRSNYGSAPFFHYFIDPLEEIIFKNCSTLWDINLALMQWAHNCLQLNANIRTTDKYRVLVDNDMVDGRGLYRPSSAFFNQSPKVQYEQVFSDKHGFIANLSVLDLIMCCGPEAYSLLIL